MHCCFNSCSYHLCPCFSLYLSWTSAVFFVYLFCSFTSGVCSIWHLDRNLVGLSVWYAAFLFNIPGYWCWFNQDNVHIFIHVVLCFDLVQSRRKKDLPTLVLFQFLACTSISNIYVLITEYRTTSGGQGEITGSVHSCCKTCWRPSLEIKMHSTASCSCDIVFNIYR